MPATSRPSTASTSGAWKTDPARPKPTIPTRRSAMAQRLQHAGLADGVRAAQARRALARDRGGEVLELEPVRVGALDLDARAVVVDARLVAVPRVAHLEAALGAHDLQTHQRLVERALHA